MYTIYKMYKDVASSRSSYAIFLECWNKKQPYESIYFVSTKLKKKTIKE